MFHNLDTTPYVAFGILEGFAGFAGQDLGDFIMVFFQQGLVTHHHPGALGDRDLFPGLEHFACVVDSATHLGVGGAGCTGNHFIGSWVSNVNPLLSLALDELTTDIKGYVFHSNIPCHCCRSLGLCPMVVIDPSTAFCRLMID